VRSFTRLLHCQGRHVPGSRHGRMSLVQWTLTNADEQVANDAGSVYSPAPSLGLTFHPYSPPNDSDPSLAESEVTLLEAMTIQSQVIHQYVPADGTSPSTFFRFIYEVPLQNVEMTVKYRLNGGPALSFVIPAKGQNMRWAAHSCNGMSSLILRGQR
jgi:hypothetical protein